MAFGEPYRAGGAERLGDGQRDAGESGPASRPGDQGEGDAHGPSAYRETGKADKPAPPVVIIAGPTASGKSALALALATDAGGTVINADSLQCYRDLRILTARPDAVAEARAPHRLYGYLDAGRRGSAAEWRAQALAEIADAAAAGRLPILVGGTGLYLRALCQGLAPVPDIPEPVRAEAAALHHALGGAAFRDRLGEIDPVGAQRLAPGDRTRLIRAYEVVRATGVPIGAWRERAHAKPPYRFAVILLMPLREALYAACDARFAAMVDAGALEEAAALAARGLDAALPAMKAVGLPELLQHLHGKLSLAAAIEAGQRATRRYAKRQATWFRHQLVPDLTLSEQFSESLLRCSRQFIYQQVLTPQT